MTTQRSGGRNKFLVVKGRQESLCGQNAINWQEMMRPEGRQGQLLNGTLCKTYSKCDRMSPEGSEQENRQDASCTTQMRANQSGHGDWRCEERSGGAWLLWQEPMTVKPRFSNVSHLEQFGSCPSCSWKKRLGCQTKPRFLT